MPCQMAGRAHCCNFVPSPSTPPLFPARKSRYGAASWPRPETVMTRSLIVKPVPLPLPPNALVAVDRAISELRRGGLIKVVGDDGCAALVMAAEGATLEALKRLTDCAASPALVAVTGRRAAVLGLADGTAPVVMTAAGGLTSSHV